MSRDAVAGASAKILAMADMTDDVQHTIAEDIGRPTNLLAPGVPVQSYQSKKVGHRFYANNLGAKAGRIGSKKLREGNGYNTHKSRKSKTTKRSNHEINIDNHSHSRRQSQNNNTINNKLGTQLPIPLHQSCEPNAQMHSK